MLRRLRTKGFVKSNSDLKKHVFSPDLAPEKVIAKSIQFVTDCYFKGDVGAFMRVVAEIFLHRSDYPWLLQALQFRLQTSNQTAGKVNHQSCGKAQDHADEARAG